MTKRTRSYVTLTITAFCLCLIIIIAFYSGMFYQSNYPYLDNKTASGTEWISYTNSQYGISFQYPADMLTIHPQSRADQVNIGMTGPVRIDWRNTSLIDFDIKDEFVMPSETSIDNEYSGIYFDASSDTSTCASSPRDMKIQNEQGLKQDELKGQPVEVKIGDLPFKRSEFYACGAGDCDDTVQYSIVKYDICYRAHLTLNESGNPDPASLTATTSDEVERNYDAVKNTLDSMLKKMLSTFNS